MPARLRGSRLAKLERLHAEKILKLAESRAEKAKVDAQTKVLEDAVEAYRKAISRERMRLLNPRPPKWQKASLSSSDNETQPLA